MIKIKAAQIDVTDLAAALPPSSSGVSSVNTRTGAVTLTSSDVGLANVNNTSDANKPISTAEQAALNAKENTVTAGTTAQYYRGDKSFQTLNTAAVPELTNLYHTTARAAAAAPVQSVAGKTGSVTLVKADVGLANVDNTSDATKQTAYDARYLQTSTGIAGLITAGTNVTRTGSGTIADPYVISSSGGSGGSSFTLLNTKRVASSTATTAEKASADYVCDGTADDVEINLALQAVKTAGGLVQLGSGTFNLSATLYIEGVSDIDPGANIALVGTGSRSTRLVAASGVHAITLRYIPKPIIMDLGINIQGTSDGIRSIAPTTGANDRRGFWQGYFKSLDIRGTNGGSSGWALNLENPFRSSFINIQVGDTTNGIWCKSVYQSDQGNQFNPGNCNFMNCQMGASGIAYRMQSNDNGGFLNIMTFSECDAFGSGTGTIGWHFIGSTTSYFTTRDMLVSRSNVEQYTTAVKFEKAANIEVNLNYVDTNANGTVFDVSANSPNNQLSAQYIYVYGNRTTKALNDLNTGLLVPTILRQSFARVESGATLSITKTAATVLEKLYRDSDGTGVYPAEWQGQTTALVVKDEGTELFRGARSINFAGAGVTATNAAGDITVTIPGGGGGGGDAYLAGNQTFSGNNVFSQDVNIGSAVSAAAKRIYTYQGTNGTAGKRAYIYGDYKNVYIGTEDTGNIVMDNAYNEARAVAIQEQGAPYQSAKWWFDGSSGTGTGIWMAASAAAANINLRLGTTAGTGKLQVVDAGGTTRASISDTGALAAVTATLTGLLTSQAIEPAANVTYNLGTTNYFANARIGRVYLNSAAYLDGGASGITRTNGDFWGDKGFKFGAGASTGTDPFSGAIAGIKGYVSAPLFILQPFASTNNALEIKDTSGNSKTRFMGTGELAPVVTGGIGIGTSSFFFSTSYISRMYLNATAYFDGATAGQITATGTFVSPNLTAITGPTRSSQSTLTASATLTPGSSNLSQFVSASTASVTITLAATTTTGYRFTIKRTDSVTANTLTITTAGGTGTIDGATSYSLGAQYKYVTVESTGTSGVWYVIGNN